MADIESVLTAHLAEFAKVETTRLIDGYEHWIQFLPVDKQDKAKADIIELRVIFDGGNIIIEQDGE